MKKNISINISGIIFHIEEDGYESLRKYLDSVSKYFSTFEDSSEIMADIESRIAEIFLSKLSEGKQVITADDVNYLMTTMGSVNDFKAAEPEFDKGTNSSQQEIPGEQRAYSPPKQLLRDQKRKTLGGVCAGLGTYLNVDPVWIRLLFALLAFAYGITILVYVIMWIAVPGSYELEEPEVTKKMFRSPDNKVLGGVAGGAAAFLGLDIIIVRVLFIAFTFAGGLGAIIYIVLWLVLPEAKTLTDKMQMQGEPVTLSNIESALKKNQNLNGTEDETTLTKILLFPFRLIAILLSALAKVIHPLADVVRFGLGIAITLAGVFMIVSILFASGILFGLLSDVSLPQWFGPEFSSASFPIDIVKNSFPTLTLAAAFAVAFIPSLFFLLLGVSLFNKKIAFSAVAGWTFFGLFFASVIVLGISIPRIIYAFKEEGEYRIEKTFTPVSKTIYLKVNQTGLDDYNVTSLTLKGYDGHDLKLEQNFGAQGNTKANAIQNAHMINYNVDFKDSVLTFDSNIQFAKDARFRAQRLDMNLYIPYDMPFIMNDDASRFITQIIDNENLDGQTWTMTKKGLRCVTCTKPNHEDDNNERHTLSDDDLVDFNAIHINGAVKATISQGDHYEVEFVGSEREKEKYNISRRGETLVISFDDDDQPFWKKNKLGLSEIQINITLPELEELELKGAGKLTVNDFEADDLNISIMGAMDVTADRLDVNDLSIVINGASSLNLSGKGQNLEASIVGASKLNADDFKVVDANVKAHGVSSANVNASGTLEIEQSFTSKVEYSGDPKVIKKN